MTQISLQKTSSIKATVLVFLGVLALLYFLAAMYFQNHFFPQTYLNGVDVSGRNANDAEFLLRREIDGYQLKLITRDGEEIINGEKIDIKAEFHGEIEKQIASQNVFSWGHNIFFPQELEMEAVVTYDEMLLDKEIAQLDCMEKANQKRPVDAKLSEYSKDGYTIIPEDPGSTIHKGNFRKTLDEAVRTLQESCSLQENDCYVKPRITSETKALVDLKDKLNKYVDVVITYDLGEKEEILDADIFHTWIKVNGTYVTIDEESVAEYVKELASKYNTVFRGHTLETSYGETVTIKEGDYGWKVDKEGEQEQIIRDITSGTSVKREIVYAQRANSHGKNDYGDTYVEINLAKQHLFFYKDGELIVETDFVSGDQAKRYDTPVGVYGITYTERDATLKGQNYITPVSYWMPFCNNVGMHDADWRSSFGGKIYKTSGSHGCINLPPEAAKKIFENIQKGDPVLVYKYPEEEYGTAPVNPASAEGVIAFINNIGAVSLANEAAVAQARISYNALPPELQAQVTNYDVLCAAEAQLDVLRAQPH